MSLGNQHECAGRAAFESHATQIHGGTEPPFHPSWEILDGWERDRWVSIAKAAVAAYIKAGGE
jgi:hypothetical protein